MLPIVMSLLIGVPLGILMAAVFLRLATKIVMKFDVPFGRACFIAFVVLIVTGVTGYLIGLLMRGSTSSPIGPMIVSVLVNLCVASGIYGAMIKMPGSTDGVGFGKGISIALMLLLIGVVIAAVLFGIAMFFMR